MTLARAHNRDTVPLKKCTKKRDVRAELLFLSLNLLIF